MSNVEFKDKNSLRFAGDVSIDRVVLTTSRGTYQEIQGQILQIQIFEDIFSPFITGILSIKDTLDLSNVLPLIGEEYLELRITTPTIKGAKIDGKFYVYKMADRVVVGDRAVGYELYFISVEAVVDTDRKSTRLNSSHTDISRMPSSA